VLFGLGIFASYRLLPRPIFWVGVFYLLAGTGALGAGHGHYALSPWFMGATFGGGHFLTAGVLYWTLERNGE
jgi:hypothetical protein